MYVIMCFEVLILHYVAFLPLINVIVNNLLSCQVKRRSAIKSVCLSFQSSVNMTGGKLCIYEIFPAATDSERVFEVKNISCKIKFLFNLCFIIYKPTIYTKEVKK